MFPLLCALFVYVSSALDVNSWYVGKNTTDYSLEDIRWDIYTSITTGQPKILPDGTAICDPDDFFQTIRSIAEAHNTNIIWHLPINNLLTKVEHRYNLLNSIATAVKECRVSGLEIDHEAPMGISQDAKNYTQLMADLYWAMGDNYTVGADVGVFGIDRGSYPLGIEPWIDIDIFQKTPGLYVNTMSYHHNRDCSIFPWKVDYFFLTRLWNIPVDRINLGVPLFNYKFSNNGKISSEPTDHTLSERCPDLPPDVCVCDGVYFISPNMAYELGVFIRKEHFRGVFPWAANYDSIQYPLIDYIAQGFSATSL